MQNFLEKPLQLLDSNFDLNQETIDYLKSFSDKQIAILSIVGPKSSGKSFLSNQLIGKFNNGFTIGSMENVTESCTKGIWIWGKPIIKNDIYIFILDSEGLNIETNLKNSQKIFTLINLISSLIIYNYKKDDETDENTTISDEVIKRSNEFFQKLIPYLKNVKLTNDDTINEKEKELKEENIPFYYWLYRDYSINEMTKYFENTTNFFNENEIFSKLFKNKISEIALPSPMDENEMLVNVYLDEEDDGKGGPFEDEYKNAFNVFKNNVIEKIEPKKINDNIINCGNLCDVLNIYTKNLKDDQVIFLSDDSKKNEEQINNFFNEIEEKYTKNVNIDDKEINEKINKFYELLSGCIKDINAFPLLKKLSSETVLNKINNMFDLLKKEIVDNQIIDQLSKYDAEINNLISDKQNKNSVLFEQKINSKEDIKNNFNKFIEEEVKQDLNNILLNPKNKLFSCLPLINSYINKYIIEKIEQYIDNINNYIQETQANNEQLTKNSNDILEQKNSEITELKQKISDLETELSKKNTEISENSQKLSEISENLQNTQQKCNDFEKKISELENKISEMEKKNSELEEEKNNLLKTIETKENDFTSKIKTKDEEIEKLNNNLSEEQKKYTDLFESNKLLQSEKDALEQKEIERNKKKPEMIKLKDEDLPKLIPLFKEFEKTVKEYSESVKTLKKNKGLIYHEQFINEAKTEAENSNKNWINTLQNILENKDKYKNDIYDNELNKLKDDNKKLNEIIETKNDLIEKQNEENKKLGEELKLQKEISEEKDIWKEANEKLIISLRNANGLYEQRIQENQKKYEDMEFKLSENITELHLKEQEIDLTLDAVNCMCEKNKKNFELTMKKLSEDVQASINSINKKYKFIK